VIVPGRGGRRFSADLGQKTRDVDTGDEMTAPQRAPKKAGAKVRKKATSRATSPAVRSVRSLDVPAPAANPLASPYVVAQRIALKRGHYALRHLGFSENQQVSGGMPFGLVECLSGDVAVSSTRSGDKAPALRAPNDTVMVAVGDGDGEITVICVNHPGSQSAGFRFVLTPIEIPEVAVAPTGKAPPAVKRQAPLPVHPVQHVQPAARAIPAAAPSAKTLAISAIGHSEILGDVAYKPGEWIGGVGNVSLRLEALTLRLEGASPNLDLEYGVLDGHGKFTWVRNGALAGSRGRAQSIFGIAVRLVGREADDWRLSYECRFVGQAIPLTARDGEVCKAPRANGHLTAVRLVVEPNKLHAAAQSPRDARRETPTGEEFRAALKGVKILAHIQNEGDRVFNFGEWVGTPGSGRAIEGLQIVGTLPNGSTIEIFDPSNRTAESAWSSLARFYGSRGKANPLQNVGFRSNNPRFRLDTSTTYVSDPQVYKNPASNALGRRKLEALRFSISEPD